MNPIDEQYKAVCIKFLEELRKNISSDDAIYEAVEQRGLCKFSRGIKNTSFFVFDDNGHVKSCINSDIEDGKILIKFGFYAGEINIKKIEDNLAPYYSQNGCDIYLLSQLPESSGQYKNSYLFIKQNDNRELYYIKPDGEYEKVNILDFNEFEEKINFLRNNNEIQLHLSNEQIKKLITSNGGHTCQEYIKKLSTKDKIIYDALIIKSFEKVIADSEIQLDEASRNRFNHIPKLLLEDFDLKKLKNPLLENHFLLLKQLIEDLGNTHGKGDFYQSLNNLFNDIEKMQKDIDREYPSSSMLAHCDERNKTIKDRLDALTDLLIELQAYPPKTPAPQAEIQRIFSTFQTNYYPNQPINSALVDSCVNWVIVTGIFMFLGGTLGAAAGAVAGIVAGPTAIATAAAGAAAGASIGAAAAGAFAGGLGGWTFFFSKHARKQMKVENADILKNNYEQNALAG